MLAGPHPAIDSNDPGPAGFSGSLIVAEFVSLEEAQTWAKADPYVSAGVYARVVVKPFKKVWPQLFWCVFVKPNLKAKRRISWATVKFKALFKALCMSCCPSCLKKIPRRPKTGCNVVSELLRLVKQLVVPVT